MACCGTGTTFGMTPTYGGGGNPDTATGGATGPGTFIFIIFMFIIGPVMGTGFKGGIPGMGTKARGGPCGCC